MSGYLRSPKKFIMRCPICVWVNIYFSSDCARLTPRERARRGLNAHGKKMHQQSGMGTLALAKDAK